MLSVYDGEWLMSPTNGLVRQYEIGLMAGGGIMLSATNGKYMVVGSRGS